ncbi:ComEA family DNA-binding protein [Robertkochia aurantiaca]|uniref:ComEA family DNA-binding protein n=1 Tax=Robertkochia aurantiaca TaxID=2873700 RepID=UPI001CCC3CCA|nr:helix-hairpin-helix domain-containing protein [Robertkochia sp. 3YJGBD-33]
MMRSHFYFNKRQRNGAAFLLVLIIAVQLVIWYRHDLWPPGEQLVLTPEDSIALKSYQREYDSILELRSRHSRDTIYPFNPNYLDDYKAYLLGLNTAQIDSLFLFIERGGKIRSKKQFRQVTNLSDSLYRLLEPSIRLPEYYAKGSKGGRETAVRTVYEKADLNTASAEALREVYGIGEVLSARIVSYRKSIGGFVHVKQLEDVYGLKEEVIDELLTRFELQSVPEIELLDVNRAGIQELAALPYFSEALAARIVAYRSMEFRIESLDELTKIQDFPSEKIDIIRLYLRVK